MVALIIGLVVCIAIALGIVALVAVPARREGRDLLTARGEDLVAAMGRSTEPTPDNDQAQA